MIDALGGIESLFVLGGTSDIGVATARRMVEQGLRRVVLAARDTAEAKKVCEALIASGVESAESIDFEALDFAGHQNVVDSAFDHLGDIDVALICFGVLGDQTAAESDPDLARTIIDTNFTAAATLGIRIAERMKRQGYGCIVALSSVAGERARRSNFVYGSSKAGMDAFFQGMAAALEGTGVRTLIVRPGFVRTKMTAGLPAPPLATSPEDVADAIVSGIVHRREIVWVPASMRLVMSVLRHLPTPVFRKIPF